jgi:hypothetical protein
MKICSQVISEEPGMNPLRICVDEFESCTVSSNVLVGRDDDGEVDRGKNEF